MRDLPALFHAKRSGANWLARCPAHDDRKASLSLGTGRDGQWLLHCHAGCELNAILAAAHLEPGDLFPESTSFAPPIATYAYHDEGDRHLYDVLRFPEKKFLQRRANGDWHLGSVRRVLYRLPELQGKLVVYIVEGEKDVHRLESIGLPATTNPGGAEKWTPAYTDQLKAAAVEGVCIIPDNDDAGRRHADQVGRSCFKAGFVVKVVTLPDLPVKGDVSDWLDRGHTKGDLVALVKATDIWAPADWAPSTAVDIEPTPEPSVTAPAGSLTLRPIGDLLAEPDDAIEWIVTDRLASGSVNLLAGKPKAGKSTLARYLAFCLSQGVPFLGSDTVGGPVWYLALEDKRSEVRRHFRALGATGREPLWFLFGQTPDLLAKLTHMADQDRPRLIVVDTLQRLIGAKDLNDYAEVTTKLTPLLTLARSTGAALLLVHHAGKADRAGIDTVLGSTALAGSVDNIFLVTRSERYRLLCSIQRIGPDLPDTVLTLDPTGRTNTGLTRHEADVTHVMRQLTDAIVTSGGGIVRADLLESCEGRRQLKLEALKRLVASGTTIRSGAGSKADPYRFSVADSGSQVPSYSREPEFPFSSLPGTDNVSKLDCGSQVPTVPDVVPDLVSTEPSLLEPPADPTIHALRSVFPVDRLIIEGEPSSIIKPDRWKGRLPGPDDPPDGISREGWAHLTKRPS